MNCLEGAVLEPAPLLPALDAPAIRVPRPAAGIMTITRIGRGSIAGALVGRQPPDGPTCASGLCSRSRRVQAKPMRFQRRRELENVRRVEQRPLARLPF